MITTIVTRLASLTVLATVIFVFSGCSKSDEPSPADNGKDRQLILAHMADRVIMPAYASFKTKLDVMKTKSDVFANAPSGTTLDEFQNAMVDAYTTWQKVELFDFGPGYDYTLRNFFNIYPTDISGIHTNINDPSVNLDFPAAYAQQGFPALDYLLFGTGGDNATVLNFFTDANEGAKRRAYVKRVTDRMSTLLNTVVNAWTTYRDAFVAKTGLDIGSSFGLVVNGYVLHYERYIRSGKIGIPSGAAIAGGGVISPTKVEAYYKRNISLTLARAAEKATADFFNGVDFTTGEPGPSLASYLDALGAKDPVTNVLLSEAINAQFASVQAKLNVLSEDFATMVQNNNQPMSETFAEMQKQVRLLKVDMTSAMSITITYTDNDGD